MNIQSIKSQYSNSFFPGQCTIDEEEKRIMELLLMYGIIPTGDKSIDRAKLYAVELEKAKQDNYVSGKYFTVSTAEQEVIQARKKEQKEDIELNEKEVLNIERQGANTLGQQVYIAIKMKNRHI